MGRLLGVDYGRERIGLALSDDSGAVALPLGVLHRAKRKGLADAVLERAEHHEVEQIIVGLPLRLDGSVGPAAEGAERFAATLRERGRWPVVLFDERLSTVEATRRTRSAGLSAKDSRHRIDEVAAAVILEAYLDSTRDASAAPLPPDLPEPEVPPPGSDPAESPEGGKATARRRAVEKRARRRSGRRAWRRDLDDA